MARYERMNAATIDDMLDYLNGDALDPVGSKDWSGHTLVTQTWDVDGSVIAICTPPSLAAAPAVASSGPDTPPADPGA